MPTTSSMKWLASGLGGIALVCLGVCVGLLWESRGLQKQLRASTTEATELRSQQAATAAELAAQARQLETLETELAQQRQAAENASRAAAGSPHRARIILGNRIVGWGWAHTPPAPEGSAPSTADLPVSVVLDLPPAAAGAATASPAPAASPATQTFVYDRWWQSYGSPYLLTYGTVDWGPYGPTNHHHSPHPPFSPPPAPSPGTSPASPGVTPPAAALAAVPVAAPGSRQPSPPATRLPGRFPVAPTPPGGIIGTAPRYPGLTPTPARAAPVRGIPAQTVVPRTPLNPQPLTRSPAALPAAPSPVPRR